jgi:hypothetical protein
MAAPLVQNLDDVIAELNPVFAPQEQLVNTQRAGLGAKYDAQRSGLTAEKAQGFNAISNQATARGMSFSGVPLDEQSTYLSTKYLPGMQNVNTQQNQEDLSLQSALAEINNQKRTRAMDIRSNQQSALEKYLSEERDRAFQAEQARLERAARASEAAQARADRLAETSGPAPGQALLNMFQDNWAKSKGTASRNTQDNWVRQYFLDNGILDQGAQNQIWNTVNQQFKRASDPRKDRMWNGGK